MSPVGVQDIHAYQEEYKNNGTECGCCGVVGRVTDDKNAESKVGFEKREIGEGC